MIDTYSEIGQYRPSIIKDPDSVLDYTFDWTDWLAQYGSSIVSYTMTTTYVEKVTDSRSGALVTVWAGVAEAGKKLGWATCRIVDSGGRTEERTIYFVIRDR